MNFRRHVPHHIFQTEYGYELGRDADYGRFCLNGAELEEFDQDHAEITAYEAPLFQQGLFTGVEDIYGDVLCPDGSTIYNNHMGYYITIITDGTEPPTHLVHPHYSKWVARMKADSRVVYNDGVWLD